MAKKIYGVDTSKKVTPLMVRDAIIVCFAKAHSEILDELKDVAGFNEKEFEKLKLEDIGLRIESMFKDMGRDFNNPTKQDLMTVINKLADYAANFRDSKVIRKHYREIKGLIDKL